MMTARTLARFGNAAALALAVAVFCGAGSAEARPDPNDEYIIVSGGPSLIEWEQYRKEAHRHDKWWGNFIRSARIRIEQLQKYYKVPVNITWMVYRPAYESRATEDGEPLLSYVESVRDKYKIRLIYFDSGDDIIRYLNEGNNRRKLKVGGFEYFGHSNKYCWTFDYSNHILGASKAFLHERDLRGIKRGVFAKDAFAQSWGCHSGESFSAAFKRSTGVKMKGAIGKTDYSEIYRGILPFLSSPGGKWTN